MKIPFLCLIFIFITIADARGFSSSHLQSKMEDGMSEEKDIRIYLGSVRVHEVQGCIAIAISKNMFLSTGYCTRYIREYAGPINLKGARVYPIVDGERGKYGYPVIRTLEQSSLAIEENSASSSEEGSAPEEELRWFAGNEQFMARAKHWMEKYEIGIIVIRTTGIPYYKEPCEFEVFDKFCSDDPPEIFNKIYKFENDVDPKLQEMPVHILSLKQFEEMCPAREVDHLYKNLKLYGTQVSDDHKLERYDVGSPLLADDKMYGMLANSFENPFVFIRITPKIQMWIQNKIADFPIES